MKELLEKIRALVRTFPMAGISGQKTLRYVDEDVFMDAVKQILAPLETAQKESKKSFDEGFQAGVQSVRANDDDGWG